MPLEVDPEHVPRLALVPVVGRVDANDGGNSRIGIGDRYFNEHTRVVRDRQERVNRVHLADAFGRVVHSRDTQADLVTQCGLITQNCREGDEVLATHVIRDLVAVDHDLLDRISGGNVARAQRQLDLVADLVEPATEGTHSRGRKHDRLHQSAETTGVT